MSSKYTDTRSIQAKLASLGFKVTVDGKTGPETRNAIKAFQVSKGLASDGIVGANTYYALFPEETVAPLVIPKKNTNPVAQRWPLQKDVKHFFGNPGSNLTLVNLAYPMVLDWDRKVVVNRISVHEKIAEYVEWAFKEISKQYTDAKRKELGLNLFGGSYNMRNMRGGSNLSMHAWGIAIDIDPSRNQLTWGPEKARLARTDANTFFNIWEETGAISLGREIGRDFMHIQYSRLK